MGTRGKKRIASEFRFVDFGDQRLNRRLVEIGTDFIEAPGQSIPSMCGSWSKTKAAYRFFDNKKVSKEDLLDAHRKRINQRIQPLDQVLLVADSTFFTFPRHPSKSGLGEVGTEETDLEGVIAHSTIAVSPVSGEMKGIYDQDILIRQQEGETIFWEPEAQQEVIENENRKWSRSVKAGLEGVPTDIEVVFVFDRGADAYGLLKQLHESRAGYVVRANQNRAIRDGEGERGRLHEWIEGAQNVGKIERLIHKEESGKQKEVTFHVQTGRCELLAPHPERKSMNQQGAIQVNVLRLVEEGAGDRKEGIEWVLLTDRELDGLQQVREVVQAYENRWKIEEWHECLKKRGTKFEQRQLQNWERMDRLLGVSSVVAWRLLGLRDRARSEEKKRPGEYLTDIEQKVIEGMDEEVEEGDSAQKYLLGVARIGGYLDRGNDPPPGWQIMWRGFNKVQQMAAGYKLAN